MIQNSILSRVHFNKYLYFIELHNNMILNIIYQTAQLICPQYPGLQVSEEQMTPQMEIELYLVLAVTCLFELRS